LTPTADRDADWNEAMDASFHATVFGDARYLEAMAPPSRRHVEHVRCDLDGEKAGAALAVRQRGPLQDVALPLFTPYSGLLLPDFAEAAVHKGADALSRTAETLESRYGKIRVHLPPSVSDVRGLQQRGWTVSPLYTYCLDVTAGLDGWSSGARRKARKSAPEFDVGIESGAAPGIIELVHEGYTRNGGTPPGQANQLAAAVRSLEAAGLAECLTARKDENLEAGIVLLHGPKASYYWMAGSKPGPAMTVLLAAAMDRLAERGASVFDLVGANTPRIAEFKRRLGAHLVQYWAATLDTSPLARAASAARVLRGT
jgi:hypothetical protein